MRRTILWILLLLTAVALLYYQTYFKEFPSDIFGGIVLFTLKPCWLTALRKRREPRTKGRGGSVPTRW